MYSFEMLVKTHIEFHCHHFNQASRGAMEAMPNLKVRSSSMLRCRCK